VKRQGQRLSREKNSTEKEEEGRMFFSNSKERGKE